MHKRLKDFRDWCPQPKKNGSGNFVKISPVILMVALLAEILILFVAPITYYALLVPKPTNSYVYQDFPLTNSQIKAAWPNLPTASQIVQDGYRYGFIGDGDWKANIIQDASKGVYNVIDTSYWNLESNSTSSTIYLTENFP